MTASASSFEGYIQRGAAALAIQPPVIENGRTMFRVGDRWIELRHEAGDDRVTFAALVYVAPPEVEMRADLIASFNLRYLFEGGFALVEGEEGFLYLCRPHQMICLESGRMRQDLEAFAHTAAMAGTWYLRALETPVNPASSLQSDSGNLLRI